MADSGASLDPFLQHPFSSSRPYYFFVISIYSSFDSDDPSPHLDDDAIYLCGSSISPVSTRRFSFPTSVDSLLTRSQTSTNQHTSSPATYYVLKETIRGGGEANQ